MISLSFDKIAFSYLIGCSVGGHIWRSNVETKYLYLNFNQLINAKLKKTAEHIVIWKVDHIALEKATPARVGWTISQNGVEETEFRSSSRRFFRYGIVQNKTTLIRFYGENVFLVYKKVHVL